MKKHSGDLTYSKGQGKTMLSIEPQDYSTFGTNEIIPEKKWEEESSVYCIDEKIKNTALVIFGLLFLYGFTGFSLAAAVTAGTDCPSDKDTNDMHCNGGQLFLGTWGTLVGTWLSITVTAIACIDRQRLGQSNKNITEDTKTGEEV